MKKTKVLEFESLNFKVINLSFIKENLNIFIKI